ncbi:MAG: NHL repeat-containing protein [Nitrospinae bacterium]|nr:NHL repeat-containing protein [Nitrospinota bacterium]MBL7020623.1 NHL repeat-containing protein [Nitrospinaceae bacterium]
MTPQDSLLSAKLDAKYRESSEEELSPPSGLCFSGEGHLLLADDFNHRIQVYDSQSNLLHCFGSKGKEPGQFQYPKGIAVDSEGNIYVADSWNHRVQKFDSKGAPLLAFGTCGDGKGELNEPYDILVEPSGNLIVVERYNHRIQFFDPQGVSMGWVGDRGTVLEEQLAELQGTPANLLSPPLFELPTSIAKDSRGNYFITDSGNHRVRKFNPQWQEIMSFGGKGAEPGQFEYPLCVTVAQNDLLYVADLNNERVQVFSPFGQYLFAIDGASSEQTFEAPCLTAIDLKGCLHIGFTFNTQIFKYLIPLISQNTLTDSLGALPTHTFYQALALAQENDDAKALTAIEKTFALLNEKAPKETPLADDLKIKASLLLSDLSKRGATIADTVYALAFRGAEDQLKQARDKALKCFLSWQKMALKFNELLLEEQKKVLKDPEGTRDFNHDLHIAEQEDKKYYRLTRNEIYSYRETVRQFSRFICNSIASELPETQLESLNDVLLRQTGETLSLIKEYFGEKERSEESMVQILGESQGEKDKLSAFLTQYYSNGRIMDLQLQLQFELQSHWFNLRTLAHNGQKNVSLENFAGKMVGDTSAFEDILKTLIGFHENWVAYPQLEQQFLNSLDTLLRIPASSKTAIKTDLTLADFTPIAYDSENLNFSGILNALKAEGSPLSGGNETVVWGQNEFQFIEFSKHKEELAACALKLMDTQTTYQGKAQELIQQLEGILRQRNNLDVQLKQAKVEDKISPITISDNIAIVQFQINLIRRMLMSLDINQFLNLHRLVLAGAFLSLTNNESSETQHFFQSFNDHCTQQDQRVREAARSRKENAFKLSALSGQVEELNSKYNISEIADSVRIENENAEVQINLDRCEFEYQRNSRIKNILDRLMEFRDPLSPSEDSLKTSFREIRILEIANVSIGHTLSPQGIHHKQDGGLVIASYENHRIYSYSPDGSCQFHFGGWGSAPAKLQYPNNLAIDSRGCIYVIEEKTCLIKKFDKEGNYLFQFGRGQLGMTFSLSIDSQDNIWVADPEHNRIIIFENNGAEIRTITGENQSTSLNEPVSIYCLPKGEYLVGDKSESLLKHFDAQDNIIHKADKADWGVDDIYFMAWHPRHGIYGSDFWNGQIVHFNNKLEVQSVYHKPGKRAGQLGKVGGLSIFNDQLAVANLNGDKVQIFDLSS